MHPELLTNAFLQRAQDAGGSLQLAAVVGLSTEGGRVTAVRVRDSSSGEERELQADAVVFALGEWCVLRPAAVPLSLLAMHWLQLCLRRLCRQASCGSSCRLCI